MIFETRRQMPGGQLEMLQVGPLGSQTEWGWGGVEVGTGDSWF